jgi:hypothetical protein
VSLPAADELFRTTGGSAVQPSAPPPVGEARVPGPAGEPDPDVPGEHGAPQGGAAPGDPAPDSGESGEAAPAAPPPPRGGEPGPATAGAPAGSAGALRRAPARSGASTPDRTERQTAATPRRRGTNRRPSGRERHDEKITVYVSAEELMDLEHARLVLRGEHGLAVDRGRIVREAVAVVLADLESRGDASILVRRLRGR